MTCERNLSEADSPASAWSERLDEVRGSAIIGFQWSDQDHEIDVIGKYNPAQSLVHNVTIRTGLRAAMINDIGLRCTRGGMLDRLEACAVKLRGLDVNATPVSAAFLTHRKSEPPLRTY